MLIALIHIRLAGGSRSIDHSFVPNGRKLAHLKRSLPKVRRGLLCNAGSQDHPGERATAEHQCKGNFAMLHRGERDRLPKEIGKSFRPRRDIKDRQTCLCDHVSVSPSAVSLALFARKDASAARVENQLDRGGISADVLPLSNLNENSDHSVG